MRYTLNRKALERLKALVRAGKYVDRKWSFSAADGNALLGDPASWTEYGMWHLGEDASAKETKDGYAYPFGKNGVVYLSALRAIASRARAQSEAAIADAAGEVLEEAERKDEEKAQASATLPDLLAYNENHEDNGRFGEGDGAKDGDKGGDKGKEDPIGDKWRQQATKKSTPKLKEALRDSVKYQHNPPNEIDKLHQKVIREELEKRGVKVFGASSRPAEITATADRRDRHSLTFLAPVDITAAAVGEIGEDGKPKLPRFDMVAYTGGPMRLEGWKFPVVVDLEGLTTTAKPRPILKDHDPKKALGHTDALDVEDGHILRAKGVISGDGPHVDEVVNSSAKGFPWQASIGARVLKNEFIPEGRSGQANGQAWEGPVNIARRTSLGEISFLALGADDATSAKIAAKKKKKAAGVNAMRFRSWAKAAGLKCAEMTDEQLKAAKVAYKAAHPDGDPDDEMEDSVDEDGDDDGASKPGKAGKKTKSGARPLAISARDGEEDEDEDQDGDGDDAGEDEGDDQPTRSKSKRKGGGGGSGVRSVRAQARRSVRTEILAERKRIRNIEAKLAEYKPRVDAKKFATIEASAFDEDSDVRDVELELVRAARPAGQVSNMHNFNINGGAGTEATDEIVAAACAMSGGLTEKYALRGLSDRQKEVATSKKLRRTTLYGMCAVIAASAGVMLPEHHMSDSVIRAMFDIERRQQMQVQAAGSGGYATLSLSGITENILNKGLLQAYDSIESVVSQIAWETDTNDFKQYKRYRLTASGDFSLVPASGDLKEMSLQDESYPNQVTTQGCIITIPRVIFINDDLGALAGLPTIIGRKAGLAREKAVFAAVQTAKTTVAPGGSLGQAANAFNFFSVGAKNYKTGAGSVLQISSMATARQAFIEQKDANGDPILVMPNRVLVPPALETTADNLFSGANIVVGALGSTAAKSTEPNLNAHRNKYKPIVSPYFGAASPVAGFTDTNWLLLTDPTQGFAIAQVGYLRGQRQPTIERGEPDFNKLGLAMRAYFDFGAALHDFRTGVWSDGA